MFAKLLITPQHHHGMSAGSTDKQKEDRGGYSSVCKKIVAMSDSIRYAGAINRYGRTMSGFIHPGTTPMLGREQTKNEFFLLSAMINMRRETEANIGSLEHVVIRHQKVKIVLIPHKDMSYYVSIDGTEPNYMRIVGDVKKIIDDS